MNSDLTFITPNSRAKLATGQANEKNQTLLDRFRVLIKDTRFFDVGVDDLIR
jgi:hypothetical protein